MASLTAAQEAEYREAFLIFDRNGDGKITNEVNFQENYEIIFDRNWDGKITNVVIFSDEKTLKLEKNQKLDKCQR